eukprot:g1109.t1
MQADAGGGRLPIPEGLSPRKIQRDCRVNLQDMSGWLEESPVFPPVGAMKPSCELRTEPKTTSRCEASRCEREVKVETELRDLWADALRRWRDDLLLLQSRDLHRYLFTSQPPRVARWLRLRDQTPGLGFTQHEVETLFAVWTPSAGFFEDVAQEMLQAMSIARLQVNLIHYNVVLSAFGPVPQWASAVSVACGLLPDAFSFTHLCSACNSWPKALGLLSQLPASNTICFNGLIRVVDRDWPLAMEILQVMSHRRLKPESWTASSCAAACDVVVNTVVSPCEQAKSWRRSLQVLLGGAVRRLSASVLRHSAAVAAIDWAMGLQLWEERCPRSLPRLGPQVTLPQVSPDLILWRTC